MLLIKRGLWTASKSASFVKSLSQKERDTLSAALKQYELSSKKMLSAVDIRHDPEAPPLPSLASPSVGPSSLKTEIEIPSRSDLKAYFIHCTLPFIGFGFFDNFIMIVAGECIEHTLGVTFCLTTMAAAANGNLISDVFGLGMASVVEKFANKIGVNSPKLSSEQLNLKSTIMVRNFGKLTGIVIGCILGMCPLLFFNDDQADEEDEENEVDGKKKKIKKLLALEEEPEVDEKLKKK